MEQVGVIGLGTMGSCLAMNLSNHGYEVHVYNRTHSKTEELVSKDSKIKGHETLESLVNRLSSPRKIILMLTAGPVIDKMLSALDKMLDSSDIVVDGGNSYFVDTIRRGKEHKFNFVGCGVSGGEYGALNGPSIMVGCAKDVYSQIGPILENISAKHNGIPCCKWLGEDGAGHFVKIVHNGIEYCEMQLLQEVLSLIKERECESFNYGTFQTLLKRWNESNLGGYLMEICIKILNKREGENYVLDSIEDKAKQKGTGKMCISSAIELESDIVGMAESVLARFMSQRKEKRVEFSEYLEKMDCEERRKKHTSMADEDLTGAFYLCKAISYIQGVNLLKDYKKEKKWAYSISDVCEVWRDGCILRCKFLDELKEIGKSETLETSPVFIKIYKENLACLENVCRFAVGANVYAPLFTSSLMWINGLRMKDRNGNLIQAMRDYFGRHGVVMRDTGEMVNIEWDE